MAEREGSSVQTIAIPDMACQTAGCRVEWGLGNQVYVYAANTTNNEDVTSAHLGEDACIHEVRWDIDMHGPIARKLVNETRSIFLKLQEQASPDPSKKAQLVKVSREYRSVIQACLMDFRHTLKRCHPDPERRRLQDQLKMFELVELIWSLCEVLFVEITAGGAVLVQLLDWLRLHFIEGNQLAHEAMQCDAPDQHPAYWDAVYNFVLQGRLEDARRLLSVHSDRGMESFQLLDHLMRRMPMYSSFTGQSLGEFEMKWRHWQEECIQRLEEGSFATDVRLEVICKVLCGQDEVFRDLHDHLGSWYSMLISRLLYQNPTVKAFDLQYYAQFCIDAYGGMANMQPWDNILLAAIEFDIHQVIRESSSRLNNWWFVAHLTDLLHHCGKMDSKTLHHGSNLREFLLLEYAASLMSHHSLWQVGADYLDHCPEFGRNHLELFVERLPLETEKKAQKVLRICEQRNMENQVHSICKVMGMRALHNGRQGSALSWALRSKDVGFATFVAEKFLFDYNERGGFSNLDLIDNLGSSMLLSSKLTFLGKYREFHTLYEDGQFKAAAALLQNLLTSKIAPSKFWLTLLMDALPLLEADEVIFSSAQTHELMYCLEELSIARRLAAKEHKEIKTQIQNTEDLESDKLNLMMLALARNLSRAIVHEGSVGPS